MRVLLGVYMFTSDHVIPLKYIVMFSVTVYITHLHLNIAFALLNGSNNHRITYNVQFCRFLSKCDFFKNVFEILNNPNWVKNYR